MRVEDTFPYDIETTEHVAIPAADGVALSARLWRPVGSDRMPVPAVIEYIPYRKRDLTRARDQVIHGYLAKHGYACLRVDMRGSGDSEGVLTDEYLASEHDDGLAVLEWVARQPWCSGTAGMIGKSWGGFNALQIAARRPPQLGAIVAVCATDDRYADDVHYMGGCLLGDNLSWASTMFAYNSCPPDPDIVGDRWRQLWFERLEHSGLWLDRWLRHQRRDEYWRHGSICEDYSAVACPVMAVSGWADGYTNAVFRLLANLEVPRRGLVGPWGHDYPHQAEPGPQIGFLQEVLRWFDRWLKDEPNGVDDEPMLLAWMQDSVPPTTRYTTRPGRWVNEETWPSDRIEQLRLTMAPPGVLVDGSETVGEAPLTVQSPITVGLFAGKWCSYSSAPDLPHDQREDDGGSLLFDSEPLTEPLELLGAPVVELEISSSTPVAMIAVRLSDVAPDDSATRMTYGLLNLTHRDDHENVELLEPGRRYRISLELNNVAQVFPAGHRLRLSLSTSYWPLAWPPPSPSRLTVTTGVSRVTLPVRRRQPGDEIRRPILEPLGDRPPDVRMLEPARHEWTVTRNLATDESVLEVTRDEGTAVIDEIDLAVTDRRFEWYRSTGNDFSSVQGETLFERAFRRGEWSARTVTRTLLRSDAVEFHLTAELDAYEGETRVFSQNWDLRVPRDHL